MALPALVKKAKAAELKQYVADGVPEEVLAVYRDMKRRMEDEGADLLQKQQIEPGPLQQALTRRAGTLTVIAEYRRKLSQGSTVDGIYDPELLSPVFREYGAAAIAVTADAKFGGCTYQDLAAFAEEQRRARHEVPGPVLVVNNDLIVDELQVARTRAVMAGDDGIVAGVVLDLDFLDKSDDGTAEEHLTTLLQAAAACDLECIVNVSSRPQAEMAVRAGARILNVVRVDTSVDDKVAVIEGLPADICKIASIAAQPNKSLNEIEQAWAVRDRGFQCAWLGEVLYKNADSGGGAAGEHPGAVLKACTSKSSLKWASPKASSGKGEGAREYLGDIMM